MTSSSGKRITALKRWLLAFCSLPDQEMDWLVPAVLQGRRLIKDKHLTHMITTGPPNTCHLIGLALKYPTGIRWVADFRDAWTMQGMGAKSPTMSHTNSVTNFVEARMIRWVMEKSDLILSVTQPITEQKRKEHPYLEPNKIVTLTNGFDPSDFVDLGVTRSAPSPVLFSYLGSFYGPRTPQPFLRVLKSLLDDGMVKPGDVRVRFVGQVKDAGGRCVVEMVRDLKLDEIVSIEPPVPRVDALRLSLKSHVALILTEDWPQALTSKLFDALASGATILNIGSGGAIADVLARSGRGIAVKYTDLEEIRSGILECIRRSQSEEGRRTIEPWADPTIQAYNYQNLTSRLVELLEGVGRPKPRAWLNRSRITVDSSG
jgi:glycosyltransferase involved in cell wall biosynthesis